MSISTILVDFVLPVLTAVLAWFANAYRNKQKKEKDILDNVNQIIELQKEYIAAQEETIRKARSMIEKIEKKFERKAASVRKAYGCKTPSEECPVLISDAKLNNIEEDCYAYKPGDGGKGKEKTE